MKRTVATAILPILFAVGTAKANIRLVDLESITTDKFPDADSVIVSEMERVEYKPDGTSTTRSETWSKILTERGRREESEFRMGYNQRYGAAKIIAVSAIGTNGTERAIDVSGTTKEMTDNSSLAANIVDPLDREIVCTIPGLSVGETLHLIVERSTFKSRIKDQWSDVTLLEWTRPILKSIYEVKAPKERPIRSRAIRHPLGNVTEKIIPQTDGSTLYVYTATNSPRMFPEPDMPPTWTQVQSVHLSTARDWAEISRWYWELCEPHLAKTTPAMTNLVNSLDRDLRRIFKFVSQDIRYMGLTMEDTSPGYAPHDVNVTFENRYGVCRDKAGLLTALLRIAGFKAYPVLINVGAKMDPDVPKPYFNHAIVAVEDWAAEGTPRQDDGKRTYTLLDPTNENTKDLCPSYLCNCSYLVARSEGEALRTSAVPSPAGNSIDATTHGDLRDDGTMVLTSDLAFSGINDTIYRGVLARATPEQRIKFFESRVKALQPGAKLIRCQITPANIQDTRAPLHVSLLAELPETVLRGTTEDTLATPFVTRAFSLANWLLGGNTSLDHRRYPLVLDTTARVRETLTIDLGSCLGEAKSIPDDTILTNGYGFIRTFAVSNAVLSAQREHTIGAVEFSPEEYGQMREDIKCVEAAERKNPAFRTDALKNANVLWHDDSTEVDVASDTTWVVTNTIVKEVLTYRGKKDSAEAKFTYNPTWKHVTVLTASVSNLNGIVSHVKPVEMNEVDVGWAAAAPRYPAGKTLIVNLPAVEVGSVITLTTVTTVTNAPAPYYGTFAFDAKDPLLHRSVRVDGWSREVRNPRRVPDEPHPAPAHLGRDVVTVSRCSFEGMAESLRRAADVEPLDGAYDGADDSENESATAKLKALRDWMARHVHIVGPGLYDVPIERQLSDPMRVIKERYATRLDYIRTLCALLKGAGYEADIVFAAQNASLPEAARRRDKYDFPNVRAFASAICRVRVAEGGFLGLGRSTTTYYLGTENEYTPLEAPAMAGCDFFDPDSESFGVITPMNHDYEPRASTMTTITLRENGAADWDASSCLWGAGVGAFRKRYAEILPEDFSRHYQSLLGDVAKAATATRELTTDTEGYPATLAFSCYVPDYACVDGNTITLKVPAFENPFPALPGGIRHSPIMLGAEDDSDETVIVRFPEGYTEIERLPENIVLADPHTSAPWLTQTTTITNYAPSAAGKALEIRLVRRFMKHPRCVFGPEYAELLRDWHRRATSLSSRTITIRRP